MIIPLSTFRVPDGKLSITAHLHGMRRPLTVIVEPSSIEVLLAEVEHILALKPADRDDIRVHTALRDVVGRSLAMVANGESGTVGTRAIEGAMWSLLWLALNHYERRDQLRSAVAGALRRTGKASITIQSEERGAWGFAVSDQNISLTAALQLMPRSEKLTSIAIMPESETEPLKNE